MTMRLPSATEATRRHRAHTWAECWRIQRRDGTVLRFTNHDRQLAVEGETYDPTAAPTATAERREAGLKELSQQLGGALASGLITADDLLRGKYDGAEIVCMTVDWDVRKRPGKVLYLSRRWIERVEVDGATFRCEVEGYTRFLRVPVGGVAAGTFGETCPYVLGGVVGKPSQRGCHKDISADVKAGIVVDTVENARSIFTATAGSWGFSYADDYYRDGEVIWTTGANTGRVSPIVQHINGTRKFTLLLPTAKPIVAGDTFTAKPGCDGKRATCRDKFNQIEDFPQGWNPGSSQMLEPPR